MLPCIVPMADIANPSLQSSLLSPDSLGGLHIVLQVLTSDQLPWPGQETVMLDWVSEFKLSHNWEPLFGLSISKQDGSGPSGGRGTKKPAPRTLL